GSVDPRQLLLRGRGPGPRLPADRGGVGRARALRGRAHVHPPGVDERRPRVRRAGGGRGPEGRRGLMPTHRLDRRSFLKVTGAQTAMLALSRRASAPASPEVVVVGAGACVGWPALPARKMDLS